MVRKKSVASKIKTRRNAYRRQTTYVRNEMVGLSLNTSYNQEQSNDLIVIRETIQSLLTKICRRIDDQKRRTSMKRKAKCINYLKKPSERRRQEQNISFRNKYHNDETFRIRHIKKNKLLILGKYHSDDQFRYTHNHCSSLRIINKYRSDTNFRAKYNVNLLNKYYSNNMFRVNHNALLLDKYHSNDMFRVNHNARLLVKYHSNEQFRMNHNARLLDKYHSNQLFRRSVINKAVTNYLNNIDLRRRQQIEYKHARRIFRKYVSLNLTTLNKYRAKYIVTLRSFRKYATEGPDCVCTVCLLTFFRDQVISCVKYKYLEKCKSKETLQRIKSYLYSISRPITQWICRFCSEKLKKQQMPSRAIINQLEVSPIPTELKKLNDLERHLIALRLPFMKIVNLVSGKVSNRYAQKGTKGPLHCVPADVEDTVLSLPRPIDRSMMIRLQLKRQLKYKAVWEEQWINPNDVRDALFVLKHKHPAYEKIAINDIVDNYFMSDQERSLNIFEERTNKVLNNKEEKGILPKGNDSNKEQLEQRLALGCIVDDLSNDEQMSEDEDDVRTKYNLGTASCIQPVDFNDSAILDNEKDILAVAPAEKNKLSSLLTDNSIEALAFPHLFPDGKGSFNEERITKLNWKEYCKARLFSADSRFASDPSYIFYLQYLGDLKQAYSGSNIAFRKMLPLTAGQSKDENQLKFLFKNDMIYRYLQSARGSPQFWYQRLKDLFGMNRQLGIPTYFVTLSCADMRWKEFLDVMARNNDGKVKENYSFQEKANLIRTNPVIAARMFERRSNMFMNMFIKGGAKCLGKVSDWFARIEMQLRGSPHTHMPLWIDGAPKYNGKKTDEKTILKIIEMCDKYITTRFPSKEEDTILHYIIVEVQSHSRNHSKSCLKFHKTICRFGFPRAISRRTFICFPYIAESKEEIERVKIAKKILREINIQLNALEKEKILNWADFDTLLDEHGWTYEQYEWSLSTVHSRPTIIHKREPNARWVNQYNEEMLRAWNANMDIQFVLDPYACARYLMSYTTKPEREMSLLLEATHKECREGNMTVREEMKKLTGTFFNHRQVSIQEAIYRATKMPLTYSSRGFVFVPAHSNSCRFLKPRAVLEDLNSDDQNIYMPNLADKYFDRPLDPDFDICMAEFASDYEIFSGKKHIEKPKTPIKYLKNLNFTVKKRYGRCAIIRFPYFNRDTDSENYFENLLSLYLPIRSRDELKKPYQLFYEVGDIYDNILQCIRKVKDVVSENRKKYEANYEIAAEIEGLFDEMSTQTKEDEWADIVTNVRIDQDSEKNINREDNPDFDMIKERTKKIALGNLKQMFRTTNETRPLLDTMNDEQQQVFYYVRNWCMRRLKDSNIEPIRLFITGGAGTGKSHLLKCLHYESTKIFSRKKHLEADENIDMIHTLITAFTGAAAVNVGGVTIHSAFGIGTRPDRLHEPLSYEKLNSYRCKLGSLKLLFIDEISLVPVRLWGAIHARLGQIMGIQSNTACFGNVGIIAIGDFYQCTPVGSSSIYTSMLWSDHFECVELNINERQKENSSFSQMLNRIRTLKKNEVMIEADRATLEKCHQRYLNHDYNPESLHLFAKNVDVDEHNDAMLNRVCKDIRSLYEIGKKGIQIKSYKSKYGRTLHGPLRLAKTARVMITKNISVADGLANGVTGRIVDFVENSDNEVLRILIECDSLYAGRSHRASCQYCRERNTICVIRENENDEKHDQYSGSGSVSKQFPLRLSWTMTIHKAQGLTVDELVLSTKDLFGPGMGYTGLSREKSDERLFLKDLHFNKFYCDANVERILSQMKRLNNKIHFRNEPNYLNILFHNVEGLQCNIVGLKNHYLTKKTEIFCIAETWLNDNNDNNLLEIDGYRFIHRTRFNSFSTNHPLKLLDRGGVGVYIRNDINMTEICTSISLDLEHIMIESIEKNILLIICYRSPQQKKEEFLINLTCLLNTIESGKRILIIGDINENSLINHSRTIDKKLHELGFINIFENLITTNDQSSLDCMYTNFLSKKHYCREVSGSFYSYHEPIYISLDLNAPIVSVINDIESIAYVDSIVTGKNAAPSVPLAMSHKKFIKRKEHLEEFDSCKKRKVDLSLMIPQSNYHNESNQTNVDIYSISSNSDVVKLNQKNNAVNLSEQLSTIGLYIIKILGDGNCFFRAVSFHLYRDDHNHSQLRTNAVNHIFRNKLEFAPYLELQYNTIDEYITYMSKMNIYADQLAIVATARIIKRHIIIHRFQDIPTLIQCNENTDNQIHIAYDRNRRHYDSIHCMDGSVIQIPLTDVRIL